MTHSKPEEPPQSLGEYESCRLLIRILADSSILYSLYKKYHWLIRAAAFHRLRRLLDRHAEEQLKIIDLMGERVHALGGVAIADPWRVAEMTTVPRPPEGAEEVPAMLSRLLQTHEIITGKVRAAITKTGTDHEGGVTRLLMEEVLRINELQMWLVAEHLSNALAGSSCRS